MTKGGLRVAPFSGGSMSITGFNRRRREQAAQTPEPAPAVATTPAPRRRRTPKAAEPTNEE